MLPVVAKQLRCDKQPLHSARRSARMQDRFALVLDAGSSGSRLRIFGWSGSDKGLPPIREVARISAHDRHQSECLRRRPGLSAYANNPAKAAEQVSELVTCAQRLVPTAQQRSTPLYIKATAGLRLLRLEEADAVLEAVRRRLRASCPFDFRGAQIISGAEEATFGWLSINHMRAALEGAASSSSSVESPAAGQPRVGWLDLGGASAQIAFELHGRAPPQRIDRPETEELVALPSGRVHLFRRSHLNYGREAAFKRTCSLLREDERRGRERRRERHRRASQQEPTVADGVQDVVLGDEGEVGATPSARLVDHPCLMRGDMITLRFGNSNGVGGSVGGGSPLPLPAGAAPRRLARHLVTTAGARRGANWTFVGSGDAEQCARLVARLVGEKSGGQVRFGGQLVASSNYFHTARFLGLLSGSTGGTSDDATGAGSPAWGEATLSADDYAGAANATCGTPWAGVRTHWHPSEWRHLRFVCFSGLYISRLLTTEYRLSPRARTLTTTNAIEHTTLDWTLGALLHELYLKPQIQSAPSILPPFSAHVGPSHSSPRKLTVDEQNEAIVELLPVARALAQTNDNALLLPNQSTVATVATQRIGAASPATGDGGPPSWCPLHLIGLLPTGICVLSSSWAFAVALLAWAAGVAGLMRRLCYKRAARPKTTLKLSPAPRP